MDTEYQKLGSENNKTMNNYPNNTKRVCQFCLKEFSSGKALGGHMRIHFQKKLKTVHPDPTIMFKIQKQAHEDHHERVIVDADGDNVLINKKPNCVICGKDFPSWKSLYGHMRCHPERGWKGINPPSFSLSSTSLSSSLSDIDDDDYRNNTRRLLASVDENDKGAPIDLTASLKGWPVTAERGRRAATPAATSEVSSSSVDVELLDAVNYLMMLSRGASFEDDEIQENHERKTDFIEPDSNEKKKRKKKVKLSDLEIAKNVSPITPVTYKYKCDVCDRSFSSHQAYGGHRSSHNKVARIMIINSNENHSRSDVPLKETTSPMCRRGFEFDLNEVPPISDGFESQLDFSLGDY